MTSEGLSELRRRGLIEQATGDLAKIDNAAIFYVGFDPTADSLHVGHLIAITMVTRLTSLGLRAQILIGDATARIGDPTGKRSARPMLSPQEISANATAIQLQISSLCGNRVGFVRNDGWFAKTSFLDFMREIGSCFSVNVMLRAECFKARLEDGLSFLELSYMLMQAYDFLHLHQETGCVLQIGGDDQWSNILAGVDLVRRKAQREVFGLTMPLLVNTDGTKMGKTEKGTVWLDPARTSPFEFFQFWRNIPDDMVLKCFKLLSSLPIDRIEAMPLTEPDDINNAKRRLAHELTTWVHGADEGDKALEQAASTFENRDMTAIQEVVVPVGPDILDIQDVLVLSGLAKSRTDARHLIAGRGVALNEVVVEDHSRMIAVSDDGAVLRKGKKTFRRIRVKS